MGRVFLRAVLLRSTDKIMKNPGNTKAITCWKAAVVLLRPDAIDDHSQAHGEGRLQNGKSK